MKIPQEAINKLLEKQRKANIEQQYLEQRGIYMNYVYPVIYQGKKVWGIGSRIYPDRPVSETFHDFIIDLLRLTLGQTWWENEIASQNKHFIMQCFLKYNEWKTVNLTKTDNKIGDILFGRPDGWTQSLVSLAFDVCSLIHKNNLPEELLKRLRCRDNYQGASYEIEIAAIFARLNCDITLLDENEKEMKHCEFVAKHRETGAEIAVEVKSRHRKGVIHQEGISNELKVLKGDVGSLINKALKQNPGDKPFLIFIDINAPYKQADNFFEKQWVKDVDKFINSSDVISTKSREGLNGIIFTNHSYHYQRENFAAPGENLSIFPQNAKFELPLNFAILLQKAVSNYGFVPNIEEFN